MRPMHLCVCRLLPLLLTIGLQSLVPSPGGMGSHDFASLDLPMPGVRVPHPASGIRRSSLDTTFHSCPTVKVHEAWALTGLGHIQSRSRCNRLKRSYTRACAQSLREGFATFKGRPLYPHQVPSRIKQIIQSKQPVPKPCKTSVPALPLRPPGHLRAFQWNASRSLDYQTWVHWCDTSPFDLVVVQETGWSMTSEWSSPRWHLIHTADRFASILFMLRSAIVRREQISVATQVPGRLLQVRHRPVDVVAIPQQAWTTQHGVRQTVSKRRPVWTTLRQCLAHLPQSLFVVTSIHHCPTFPPGAHE